MAAYVSACESGATPSSFRYPTNCPRTTFVGSTGFIDRRTRTFSSRSRSGSKDTGGSIATNVSTWNRWVATMSRIVPVCS